MKYYKIKSGLDKAVLSGMDRDKTYHIMEEVSDSDVRIGDLVLRFPESWEEVEAPQTTEKK